MIAALFSIDQVGSIGHKGTLPWREHHPEDMAWFKELTIGHIVVMGRRTWDDPRMRRPLPGRTCYVVTHQKYLPHARVISGDIPKAIQEISNNNPDKHVFIIGGAELIESCKDITDRAFVAHRRGSYYSDVRLNTRSYFNDMRITSSRPSEDRVLNFCEYKNINPFRHML